MHIEKPIGGGHGDVGGLERFGGFVAPTSEVIELRDERPHPLAALRLRQRAGFERAQVAVYRRFGLGNLGFGYGQLLLVLGAEVASAVLSVLHGPLEQVVVRVSVEEGVQDCGVQLLGW